MAQDHVLVVDDEPMIRMIIVDSLSEAGFEVLEASSADEAMVLLDRDSLVGTMITDVKMPGSMDGMDLAKAVSLRWEHISLLVMSGHASEHDPRLPQKARFLCKPFSHGQLLKQVLCA